MKHLVIFSTLFFVMVFISCNDAKDTPKEAAITAGPSKEEVIKRGEYLVKITGCNDCHSPKKPGPRGPELIPELILSGYSKNTPLPHADKAITGMGFSVFAPDLTASVGPWGESFAGNLTPDSTSGIGGWTEEQFKKALTMGKFKGQDSGRMLLPPMPWPNYSKMTDDDIKAIFAYLKSIPPVSNTVPLPISPDKL